MTASISPSSKAPGRQLIPAAAWVQMAILAALLIAAYWVTLADRVIDRWLSDPNWSHGWLVPVFSLYLLATQRQRLARAVSRPTWAGLLVLLAALAVYFWFLFVLPMGYPQSISLVLVIAGLTLFLTGWQVLRVVWFPIAFLALAIPLPESLYVTMTMPLRKLASEVSAALLSLIPNLECETSGVVIDYYSRASGQYGTLNVEEACSGMRLMMAFVTLGLAMAYLGRRPNWQRIIMVLCCIPIALLCNIIRVTLTGLIHVYEIDSLASGAPHEMLGLAMLPIALGLFALVGWVLKNLFVESAEEATAASPGPEESA